MVIITIETENSFGIGQHAYMAEHIDWPAIIAMISKNQRMYPETKYKIRTLQVNHNG